MKKISPVQIACGGGENSDHNHGGRSKRQVFYSTYHGPDTDFSHSHTHTPELLT